MPPGFLQVGSDKLPIIKRSCNMAKVDCPKLHDKMSLLWGEGCYYVFGMHSMS